MSRVATHTNVTKLIDEARSIDPRRSGQFIIGQMRADTMAAPGDALHDLPTCLLDDQGNLRKNSWLLDEKGNFVFDEWQESAKLITKQLRKLRGNNSEAADPKSDTYLAALHMILIEGGDNDPNMACAAVVREQLRSRSFIKALEHQDTLDKQDEPKKALVPQEEPVLPLVEKLKANIVADSGRSEAELDPKALSAALGQAFERQVAAARKKGNELAGALIEQKTFSNIDESVQRLYFETLALEAIGGAGTNEIGYRRQIKKNYENLPDDLEAAEALKRPSFTSRSDIRRGTVTPEGAVASKSTGFGELGA